MLVVLYDIYLVANILRGLAFALGRIGNLLSMFVGTSHKVARLVALQAVEATNDITGGRLVGMSHMGRSVSVINGGGQVKGSTTAIVVGFFLNAGPTRLAQISVINGGVVQQGPTTVLLLGAVAANVGFGVEGGAQLLDLLGVVIVVAAHGSGDYGAGDDAGFGVD